MTLRFTYAPWGETLAELVDAARAAEAAGAEVVWVPELHRSATVTAAALAAGTRTVGVGTAIALAFTRSPMVTALEAMDLDELSGGRFVLGLGTGVQRLNEDWHNAAVGQAGRPPARDRRDRPRVRRASAPTASRSIVEGEYEHAADHGLPAALPPSSATEIPIYLAAMGPVMTRLAGEIGDGWISHELCSPRVRAASRCCPNIDDRVSTAAGATRDDIDLVVSACCAVDADGAAARRRGRGHRRLLRERCAPTPTSSPSTASPTTSARHRRVPRRARSRPQTPRRPRPRRHGRRAHDRGHARRGGDAASRPTTASSTPSSSARPRTGSTPDGDPRSRRPRSSPTHRRDSHEEVTAQ